MDTNDIYIKNIGLIKKIVFKFNNLNRSAVIDIDDLYSVGCDGMIRAIQTYDENKNVKFSTYAYKTCHRAILREYLRFNNPIKYKRHNLKIQFIYDHEVISNDDPYRNTVKLSLSRTIDKLLNAKQKQFFYYHFYCHCGINEVSQKMGVTRQYVGKIKRKVIAIIENAYST